jgi:flagellar biogenesis protein FliO
MSMLSWLESMAGPNYAPAILWTFAALVLLVILLVIVRLIRGLTFGTYVAGGKNRKTRLAVMDATAVDSHRRLVLVRRDDIEHLILIGGPTDVVVERDIRMVPSRRPILTGDGQQQQPAARPAGEQQRQQQPSPSSAPARRAEPPRQQAAPSAPTPHREPTLPLSSPPRVQQPAMQAAVRQEPVRAEPPFRAPPEPLEDPLDDALMHELEVSLEQDDVPPAKTNAKAQPTLDDEMAKLLGELSSHKR